MLELNVNNETSRLLTVILGTAKSSGDTPTAQECYDPKSRENVLKGTYPKEKDMIQELDELENVLLKYDVKVYRPDVINHYNQIFSRDIGFVIDDSFIISNILTERSEEISAIDKIVSFISIDKIIIIIAPAATGKKINSNDTSDKRAIKGFAAAGGCSTLKYIIKAKANPTANPKVINDIPKISLNKIPTVIDTR